MSALIGREKTVDVSLGFPENLNHSNISASSRSTETSAGEIIIIIKKKKTRHTADSCRGVFQSLVFTDIIQEGRTNVVKESRF